MLLNGNGRLLIYGLDGRHGGMVRVDDEDGAAVD